MEPAKPAEKRGLTTPMKVLIGCGVGCGVVAVAAVVAGVLGFFWLISPGKQTPTDAIVGDDSLGAIRVEDLAEDPGARQLVTRVLTRMQEIDRRHQAEDLPPSLRWLQELQQSPSAQDIEMFIPREVTLTFERAAAGEEPHIVVAFNLRGLVRLVQQVLALAARAEGPGGDPVKTVYRGHEIFILDPQEETVLAFVGGTLLFSDHPEAVKRAIDRIEAGAGAAHVRAVEAPAGDWDVAGSLDNEEGLLDDWLQEVAAEEGPPPGEVRRLGFGFDLVSADEVAGTMILECADVASAVAWLPRLEAKYREMAEEAAGHGLTLTHHARAEGSRVLADLRLEGLEAALDRWLERVAEEGEAP